MKAIHRKLNVYFFGEEAADAADQVMYYGTFGAAACMMGLLVLI